MMLILALSVLSHGANPIAPVRMPVKFQANTVYLHVRLNHQSQTFYVDSGGAMVIAASVANGLGLPSRPVTNPALARQLPMGTRLITINNWRPRIVPPPAHHPFFTMTSLRQMRGWPRQADGILGQAWLGGHVWTWNYPARSFWLDPPGWSPPSTNAHPLPIAFQQDATGPPTNHFIRISVTIDHQTIPLLLDTGAETDLSPAAAKTLHHPTPQLRAASMIMQRIFQRWHRAHPDWPVILNAQATTHAAMIRVPAIRLAGIDLGPVWFTERPNRNYAKIMSSMTAGPVEGSLGGNALAKTILTIDYPNAKAWIARPR